MSKKNALHLTTRRSFLKLFGAGAVTIASANSMSALALPGDDNGTVLVNVFLRGGADGLNIVVPYGDDDYYRLRGSIAQSAATLADLDGFFGLHGAFAPLYPLYLDGDLAFVHATGSNDPTRSHFSAQDNMDLAFGTGGWMQRALAAQALGDSVSGVSIGKNISPSLLGPFSGVAIKNVEEFKQDADDLGSSRIALEAMYGATADALTKEATLGGFESIDRIAAIEPANAGYPKTSIGTDLGTAATLIKGDVGVRMVSVNFSGWDHHSGEVAKLQKKGSELSRALASFKADLGEHSERVLTIVMTEFGRTARQNGSGGTDHGHGNIMMLMGGRLAAAGGGRVHLAEDTWVGLSDNDLHDNRDLAITTDFRSVFAEALERHMGMVGAAQIFPDFAPDYLDYLPA